LTIALVDTSIFCNILAVPGRAQRRDEVLDKLEVYIESGVTLFLPVATILETGNHIAHISNGAHRYATAKRFVEQVRQALDGTAPWMIPEPLLDPAVLQGYLDEFPDAAMREMGLGDLSIVHEYERLCDLVRRSRRVFIWSLDQHLSAYDFEP
jgi:hypothetical protein